MTSNDIAHIADLRHTDEAAALALADQWNASRETEEMHK